MSLAGEEAHSMTLTTLAAGGGERETSCQPEAEPRGGIGKSLFLRFSKVRVGRVGCILSRVKGGSF